MLYEVITGLVDAGEALDDLGPNAEIARRQSGVLAAGALTVVFAAQDHAGASYNFV